MKIDDPTSAGCAAASTLFQAVVCLTIAAFLAGRPVASSMAAASQPAAATANTLTFKERRAGWKLLFNGKDLDGWKASEQPGTFSVAEGQIVVHGARSHLFYLGPVARHGFRDFELKLEVMTWPGSNSGVYFHTAWQSAGFPDHGFEVQINNSHRDPKRTAGLYDIRDNYDAVAQDNEWFTMTIRVQGRRIVTSVNDRVVVDYTEPADWVPPGNHIGRRIAAGTFAIQGHDPGSEVHLRNIKVRELS